MKAYLAAVLEDLAGEYVLNISKDNLKLAALRGKIKIDNVELDGDYIGSHILGAVGLSGFGVLSCWARTLQINIPWANLDTSPTSLEIREMHLVCVPLLPATANRMYDGSSTLRTRAKRSALARFERNFFAGRIVGEGPYYEINQSDGETLSYNGRRRRWSSSEEIEEDDHVGESIGSNADLPESATPSSKKMKAARLETLTTKLTAKIYDNLVTSVSDVHIRCEIPEGGLNGSLPQEPAGTIKSNGVKAAFGLTLKSLFVRNVAEDEAPAHDINGENLDREGRDRSSSSEKTHKKVEVKDLAMYWDDNPPFILSESDLLNGRLSLPAAACQRRIAEAMREMFAKQDPGFLGRKSLSNTNLLAKNAARRAEKGLDHNYVCSSFSQTTFITLIGEAPEDSFCFAQILPCRLDLHVTSQQYKQYQLLKNSILSQQRFDTMLHQRPQTSPREDPRSWWKYAIACVKHKPTNRGWTDVQRIVHARKVYLELVVKNLTSDTEKGGYHGGLSDSERQNLVELEDLLPIETLLSFHLLALRQVFAKRCTHVASPKKARRTNLVNSFTKRRSSSTLGRLMNSIAGSSTSWHALQDECHNEDSQHMTNPIQMSSTARETVTTTQTTCQLHACKVRIVLLETAQKILKVVIDVKGSSYISSGSGKAELTFDITKFEVFDFVTQGEISSGGKIVAIEPDNQEIGDCIGSVIQTDSYEENESVISSEIKLPPTGVVCQVIAMLDLRAVSLCLSAHPATLIWSKTCADSVARFFASSTSQLLLMLKNAATPVAQRDQLAIFYPTSLSLTVDMHAPKLWFPVSNQMLDGALFLDSGKLKMVLSKAEQSFEANWTADVADIQIMLTGDTNGTVLSGKGTEAADLDGVSRLQKELTTVVHPFHITVQSFEQQPLKMECLRENLSPGINFDDPTEVGAGHVSVKVGRIFVDLVDVEELARAIGRFYSWMVVGSKSALEPTSKSNSSSTVDLSGASQYRDLSGFEVVHICFEKIEMALERYSSQRTYLVEVYSIKLGKKKQGNVSFSRLSIHDFTIVQLTNANCNQASSSNVRYLKPSNEPQHKLLARKPAKSVFTGPAEDTNKKSVETVEKVLVTAPHTPKRKKKSQTSLRTPETLRLISPFLASSPPASPALADAFIKGCHFHDGKNHVDEVEFDVSSAIVKVTPTSISDCTMWLTRAFELIQIASKEMERRVHEWGRKARMKEKKGDLNPAANATKSEKISSTRGLAREQHAAEEKGLESKDSSLIFRVTFQDLSVLVGRPASEFQSSRGRTPTDYVVEIMANASIMTQSIENVNGTGSRIVHLSLQDLSASVNPDFQHANSSDVLLLRPMAVDCRLVYDTVGEGRVSFQDFSFDCHSMEWWLEPHDIRVVSSVARKVAERLQLLQASSDNRQCSSLSTFVHSKRKGSRIATRVRVEIISCSFVLIRSLKTNNDTRPFIELNLSELKASLEGCIDAMNGEVGLLIGAKFFNPSSSWEDIIDSSRLILVVDQIPNNWEFSLSLPDVMNINCTASMIKEISSNRHSNNSERETKSAAATKLQSRFKFFNKTGFEVVIGLDKANTSNICVPFGRSVSLDLFLKLHGSSTLFLEDSAKERQTIHNLPLFSESTSKQCSLLHKWYFRNTPKDTKSIEPVVETIMENQRIRPNIKDVTSLERGQDLLSSSAWSPVSSCASKRNSIEKLNSELLWLPPYLEEDAYEWSDVVGCDECYKADFVLPDNNWMWVDAWEIEINEDLTANDADGWEYATDFETFSVPPRSYQKGDLCRRRRWRRTRMIKQVQMGSAAFVWDVRPEGHGSIIKARGHVQIHNHTDLKLSFFGICHSWDNNQYIGSTAPKESLCVPLQLASATHIRLAIKKSPIMISSNPKVDEFYVTEQLMILPSGFISSRIIRTSILCEHKVAGFLSIKHLHFLLTLKCCRGLVDICIEPALKVINLLPCELQCQLGELRRSIRIGSGKITQTELLSLSPGKEGKCLSIDCGLSPHTSVRLPGYKWSSWKKIVNRESNSDTWRPTKEDEVALFEAKERAHNATEFKSIVHLDHKSSGGDPIDIVMSIEMGHSPILRFYAQYWILDKTGLSLSFTGSFTDLLATTPETLRKTHLSAREASDRSQKLDMEREGYEWSFGMSGMSLFFSRDETIALSVKHDTGETSQWTSLIDISNVMPETVKTAISIDQCHGLRRFELAYNVTLCSSIFSRTRAVTFFPRYQLVNLLGKESLFVAQEGALDSEMCIPPQSYVHFHWANYSLAPKIRICMVNKHSQSRFWSRGCIQLDKIGVTAMRIPHLGDKPKVVQAEVRLATKKQDSAVVVTIWASIEKSNPLYLLKNDSRHTIFCRQQLSGEGSIRDDDFRWTLDSGKSIGFGFDDPEYPHVIQWTWSNTSKVVSAVEVDAMGSKSVMMLPDGSELVSEIQAEQSTKTILFSEGTPTLQNPNDQSGEDEDDEIVAVKLRLDLTGINVSVIDNTGREILFLSTEGWHAAISQSREGFHELELRLRTLQLDNFVFGAEHPVLIYCPSNEDIPFLHVSVVRSMQQHSETLVFDYCALRITLIEICLDRKTAEKIAHFLHPLRQARDEEQRDEHWISALTLKMKTRQSRPNRLRDIEKMVHTANSGRIYLRHLHLHPIRLSLTFTQEGMEWSPVTEGLMVFQLIRGMASIAEAPLLFTSFVVSHAFESPQTLLGIISAHYSSQLSSQILTILGSLVILKAPADILSNVGQGVRDFFYEPINGLVHGPAEFLQGVESGTVSLARGIFTGLVRGTASVTNLVSHNLANCTSDNVFIDERNAYQKKLMHALKFAQAKRTMQGTLTVAGTCVAKGFSSGANGILEQPSSHASKHGAAGLAKGIGKAFVGAIVKPVVGVGDAAVVVMNHVSGTTSDKLLAIAKAKRLRRALPRASADSENNIKLVPYDESSAEVQQIVTDGETEDDAYIGHVKIPGHLIIASNHFLWIINEPSISTCENPNELRRIRWAEVCNFGTYGHNNVKIDVFSGQGPRSFTFEMSSDEMGALLSLMSIKMGSSQSTDLDMSSKGTSYSNLPGIKAVQVSHVFGSVNKPVDVTAVGPNDDFIKRCYARVTRMGSYMPNFFQLLDLEVWMLICSVGKMFTGLSSRRCVAAGIINGSGETIQIKTAKLVQGRSPCYTIPTIEYNKKQGILHPGGAVIFFGWGAVPSLLQPGKVLISIETNFFTTNLTDNNTQSTTIEALPHWQVSFLEKSYDESGWWAKYWMLVQKKKTLVAAA